jgi:hypothetical protein
MQKYIKQYLPWVVVIIIAFVVGSKGCPQRVNVPQVAPWTRPTIEKILHDTLKVPFWKFLIKEVKPETVYRVIIQPPPTESLQKIFYGSYDGKTLILASWQDSTYSQFPFHNVNIPFSFTSRTKDIQVKCSRKFPLKFGIDASILINNDKKVETELEGYTRYKWLKIGLFVATDRGYGCKVGVCLP